MNGNRILLCCILLAATASPVGCASEGGSDVETKRGETMGEVRDPVVAGAFYPGSGDALAKAVDQYMDGAEPVEL